uniref:DNA repair radA-like protein n=1 Tax=Aegilops tauschii TaxID=37682 RepID=M8BD45_AEGTA
MAAISSFCPDERSSHKALKLEDGERRRVDGCGTLLAYGDAPSPPTSSSDREEEEEEEEEVGGGKPRARPSGGKREPRWADVATARRAAGKGGKAPRVSYVCSNCGDGFSQWWGTCRGCQAVGTLTKFFPGADSADADADAEGSHHAGRSWIRQKSKEMVPKKLREVTKGFDQAGWRIPLPGTFGNEISRVLGGGVVPGSLVLVGGDPGVGKSTLMLQLASIVSEGSEDHGSSPVVYVSGEESIEQIANRADRMSIKSKDLYLYSSTDIEDILDKIQPLSPKALVVDSIQTVYLSAFAGSAGNQVQIGHVTKTGDIAGPRVLEHIVDVVLYMECKPNKLTALLSGREMLISSTVTVSEESFRFNRRESIYVGFICPVILKLGVFEMSEHGLQAVLNPSEMFLTEHDSDSEILAGLAVAVVLDGSRTFAIEVQALSVPGSLGQGKVVGTKSKRVEMIISVLMKQAGLKLQDNVIYLNVVSGFELSETAGDLAIAASICSSFLEFPIPNDIAFIGEIGLGGELRTVPRMDKRVMAIAKLGYRKCVVPKTSEKLLKPLDLDIQILPCNNLKEFINTVFRPEVPRWLTMKGKGLALSKERGPFQKFSVTHEGQRGGLEIVFNQQLTRLGITSLAASLPQAQRYLLPFAHGPVFIPSSIPSTPLCSRGGTNCDDQQQTDVAHGTKLANVGRFSARTFSTA